MSSAHTVASGHPATTQAASETLKAGGNAFDAIVAAGFASTVAEPTLASLGGGGFALTRTARGEARLFDFFVDTPGLGLLGDLSPHFEPVSVQFPNAIQQFNVGAGSAAVPGCLKGFLHLHEKLGRLALSEVLAPAIKLARYGVVVSPFQAEVKTMLAPILTLMDEGRRLFAPDGRVLSADKGERFRNPDLADFLESLLEQGEQDFYRGSHARQMAQDMRDYDGLITLQDLAAYRVIERQPLHCSYRGKTLLSNPAPSFGGTLIALSLDLLEAHELQSFGSITHLETLMSVMTEVNRRRDQGLLSQAQVSKGTTHISVADAEGNVASMTTSNGEGSGYVVPGTGIMLNNMLGEDDLHPQGFHADPPGQRVSSMMSPSVVLDGDDVQLVLGSGGSKRIRTAILQVIVNVIDFGMSLEQAVTAPRMHLNEEVFDLEPGFDKTLLKGLKYKSNPWSTEHMYFGGVHAIMPLREAVGDRRRGGTAEVIPAP